MSDVMDLSGLNLADKITIGEQVAWDGFSNISRGILFKDDINTEVAVKSLRVQGNAIAETKERLQKRFYREVLLWRRLQHPNIVPLLGYTMPPNEFPTLISPWYANGNVVEYLALNSNADRSALALDVVKGLIYLHSIPVAHGDLKGENVLVNDNGCAMLCDFGMSQFIDEASRIIGFTTTNAYIGGTDRFLCPELLEDAPKCTATDIWALGCLVVLILTDIKPYSHIIKRTAVLSAVMRGHPPMANRNGKIGKSLWDCIKKCWSIAQKDRPRATMLLTRLTPPEDLAAILKHLYCSASVKTTQNNNPRVKFSPDGSYLAVAAMAVNGEDSVGIWKVGRNALTPLDTWTPQTKAFYGVVWKVAWSPSQRYLLVIAVYTARVFAVETGKLVMERGRCEWGTFLPASDSVAFLGLEREIFIQDLNQADSTESTTKLNLLPKDSIMMAFSPDHERVTVLTKTALEVYNVKTDTLEATAPIPKEDPISLRTISLSKDGRAVLLSSRKQNPEIWRMVMSEPNVVSQLSLQHRYEPVGSGIECAMFGGKKEEIIIAASFHGKEDLCICIWNRSTTDLIHTIPLTGRNLRDISFIPNSADTNDMTLTTSSWSLDKYSLTMEVWSVL